MSCILQIWFYGIVVREATGSLCSLPQDLEGKKKQNRTKPSFMACEQNATCSRKLTISIIVRFILLLCFGLSGYKKH